MLSTIFFFIVHTSNLFQGTLSLLGKWLQLEAPKVEKHEPTIQLSKEVDSELIEMVVPEDSPAIGKK